MPSPALYYLTLTSPRVPSLRVRVSQTGTEIVLTGGERQLVTAANAAPFLTDVSLRALVTVEPVESPDPLPAVPAQE